jgi:hypothetical protein
LAVSRNLVNSLSKERASCVPPKEDTNFFTTGRQRNRREELGAVKQKIIPLCRGFAFPFSLWAWSSRRRSHSCITWNRAETRDQLCVTKTVLIVPVILLLICKDSQTTATVIVCCFFFFYNSCIGDA